MRIIFSIEVASSVALAVFSDSKGSALCSTSASCGSWTPNVTPGDFANQVDIGGGRKLYLECHGTGSPVVILESGYHDSSQPWSLADAYPPAVLSGVACFTKVCAYDRPGTLLYADRPQYPRTDAANSAGRHERPPCSARGGPGTRPLHSGSSFIGWAVCAPLRTDLPGPT